MADRRVIELVRRMLKAAVVMPDGTRIIVREGTPQGGPLSPLLSNIVLYELDQELARRGHRFVRYADDCNVFVGSSRAGARVMASIAQFLASRMRLQVNTEKSAVRHPSKVHFLGFRFLLRQDGQIGVLLSAKTERRLTATIREMTPPNWGRSITTCMDDLSRYLTGWMAHYRLCSPDAVKRLGVLDAHIRRRLRAIIVRQKKRPRGRAAPPLTRKAPYKPDAGPHVRFCERRGGEIHRAYSTLGVGARRWWATIGSRSTIAGRGARVHADRVVGMVSRIYSWAIDEEYVDSNPAYKIRKAAAGPSVRERVLTAKEIGLFWNGLDKAEMSEALRLIFRLALLTGQRRSEVAGMRKCEINHDERLWTLPGDRVEDGHTIHGRTKNRRDHIVPLTEPAMDVVLRAIALSGDSEFVFPSPVSDGRVGHINGEAVSMAMRRNRETAFGVPDMRTHDLRRTLRTYLGEQGIPDEVADRVLNQRGWASETSTTTTPRCCRRSAPLWSSGQSTLQLLVRRRNRQQARTRNQRPLCSRRR